MYNAIKDRIIVKLSEVLQEKLIFLDKMEIRNRGTVLSIGEDVKSVKKGDEIIFHPFDEIRLPEDNLAVVREKSVLAIIEK